MAEQASAGKTDRNVIRKLRRKARLCEALTFVAVILVSPVSFILGLPFVVEPEIWSTVWLRYVIVFIPLGLILAAAGLGAASRYWLQAERLEKGHLPSDRR